MGGAFRIPPVERVFPHFWGKWAISMATYRDVYATSPPPPAIDSQFPQMYASLPARQNPSSESKKLPSIYVWVRGLFVYNSDLSGLLNSAALADSNLNTLRIASHLVSYHAYHNKSTHISYCQWHRIASSKIGLSDEATFAFFCAAQINDDSIEDDWRVRRFAKGTPSGPSAESLVPLLHLIVLICIVGATRSDSRGSREVAFRKYILKNIDQICRLIVLCHGSFLKLFESPRELIPINLNQMISADVLRNFNILFEGAVGNFELESRGARAVPLSELAMRYWADGEGICYNFLVRRIQSVLQTDPFQIGFCEDDVFDSKLSSQQTATPAADPDHRSVTIRNPRNVSLVDKDYYVGSNLRIDGGGDPHCGPTFIALRPFKTATVANCSGHGKILLGRVDDTLFVRNVHGLCISAICRRIIVENSSDLRLFLNAIVAPVVVGSCSDVFVGPYNVFDESLIAEIRPLEENFFRQPVELKGLYADTQYDHSFAPIVAVMPETEFYVQPTPFTNSINFQEAFRRFETTIPHSYLEAWRIRREGAAHAIDSGYSPRLPSLTDKDKKKLLRKSKSSSKRSSEKDFILQ
ncbi:hypothetical protein L596_007993 [Steinernema carpocapsae]|uniref:Tubulin binding cofactor C-like domain-containing protein n=1 Tax=Steinernema carpocapsae TaxID=34508 RepID=A0A4U5PBC5_STECR|nr:hypothetical protein L596_007993 [Steinernema carpocapsae]